MAFGSEQRRFGEDDVRSLLAVERHLGGTNLGVDRPRSPMEGGSLLRSSLLCSSDYFSSDRFHGTLQVTVVSDMTMDMPNAKVIVDEFDWSSGFTPVHTYQASLTVPALSAIHVPLTKSEKPVPRDHFFRARLQNSDGSLISPENVLLPNELFSVDHSVMGTVTVQSVTDTGTAGQVSIQLTTTAKTPLVWLEVSGVVGWFDDNAFTMTSNTKTVIFHSWYPNTTANQIRQALSVVSLKSWY